MRILKDRNCLICNIIYTPTGSCSKHCETCAKHYKRTKAAADQQAYRIRNGLIKNPGVGSGNGAGKGKDHHSYVNGLGCDFQNVRKRIKEERRYCQKCDKDLIDATRYHWCIHHIDHDRTNNVETNFQLLCKRCHQIEHECHKAFGTRND
jgi:hypothetical protein